MMNFKFSKERVINIESDAGEDEEEEVQSDEAIKLTNESQYLSDNDEIELKAIPSSINTSILKNGMSEINSLVG